MQKYHVDLLILGGFLFDVGFVKYGSKPKKKLKPWLSVYFSLKNQFKKGLKLVTYKNQNLN